MPELSTIVFYVFSAILLLASSRVISVKNPVHAALFLVLAFFSASALWMLLKAEFLAIALVLVYVGAVMVLFLFVVMMLDIHIDSLRQGFWRHFPLALLIGGVVTLEMAVVLFGGFRTSDAPVVPETVTNAAGQVIQYSNAKALGTLLYTKYLYPVEIAAVLLLIAMVTAIALTLRERKDNKKVDESRQVRVRAADRFEIVKLAPTRAPLPAEPVVDAPAQEAKK